MGLQSESYLAESVAHDCHKLAVDLFGFRSVLGCISLTTVDHAKDGSDMGQAQSRRGVIGWSERNVKGACV